MQEDPPLNDKDLEKRAAADKAARGELQEAVQPTLSHQADNLIQSQSLDGHVKEDLVTAGGLAFDHAFNTYVQNGRVYDDNDNFSPYFGWWARQAMVEYMENKHRRL